MKNLTSLLPDTVKITFASLVIAAISIGYVRVFMIEEIKAYSDPIQKVNEVRFSTILKHSDDQFQLMRDDLLVVKQQNSEILLMLKK